MLRHHRRGQPSLLPFKTGAFAAAISAGVPILPVVFSHYHFLDSSSSLHPSLERGRVEIHVLDPVETEGMDPRTDAQALADDVRRRMLAVLVDG